MKWITPFLLAAVVIGCSAKEDGKPPAQSGKKAHEDHGGHDKHGEHAKHEDGAQLMVKTEPPRPRAGEPTSLKLMIHDAQGAMVKDFAVIHEKKIHLIIVREGLDQFAHEHPELDAKGNISISFTFPVGGKYRLFADYQPAGGKPATARGAVEVAGTAPTAPQLTVNVPGKAAGDGLRADIAIENAKKGEKMIGFKLTDSSEKPVADLQPYLGAMGHLVVISADGEQYVHAHPMGTETKAADGKVEFMAHFPKPGIYKGWGQFQRAGKIHVIPFVAKVGDASQAATDQQEEDEADIESALAKLSPEDRRLAEAQKFCPIMEDSRLGSMGTPIKVMVKDKPVFLCCKGCSKKALANPEKTLAQVEEFKAKSAKP